MSVIRGRGRHRHEIRAKRARPPNINGRRQVEPYGSAARYGYLLLFLLGVNRPFGRVLENTRVCVQVQPLILSIDLLASSTQQLYAHSSWVLLSCHWGEVTVFVMEVRLDITATTLPGTWYSVLLPTSRISHHFGIPLYQCLVRRYVSMLTSTRYIIR